MIAPRNELLSGQEELIPANEVIRQALTAKLPERTGELVVSRTIEVEDPQGNTRMVHFMEHAEPEVQA